MIKLGKLINMIMEEDTDNSERFIIIRPMDGNITIFKGTIRELYDLLKLDDKEQNEFIARTFGYDLRNLNSFSVLLMKPVVLNEQDHHIPVYNRPIVIRIY